MRWQVVVYEKLSRKEEERYVVNSPDEEEESSVIPEAIADRIRYGIHSTSSR